MAMGTIRNKYRLMRIRRQRRARLVATAWILIAVFTGHAALVYFVWPRVFGFSW